MRVRELWQKSMTTLHEVSFEIAGFTLEASFSEIGFLGADKCFWDVLQELVGVKISVCHTLWGFLL